MDAKCMMILDEYRNNLETFEIMKRVILENLADFKSVNENGLVNSIEARIKTEKSLSGKLELKGGKYSSLFDITDIVGARVVAFYADEVDKMAALAIQKFEIDWENSVDKRKLHNIDEFGYMSLHFICRIRKDTFYDPEHPLVNEFKFELQLRTTLQHTWASNYHDTGYKNDIEVPREYLRGLSRLAGLLELADQEFVNIRASLDDYRRKVKSVVASGKFDEVELNGDSFQAYVDTGEFDKLNKRIAHFNKMEIADASLRSYLSVFKYLGMQTLEDIHKMVTELSEDAYKFVISQMTGLDIDIISRTSGINGLMSVYIIKNDLGVNTLATCLDLASGESQTHLRRAKKLYELGRELGLVK